MNSFSFTVSGNHFICPSILRRDWQDIVKVMKSKDLQPRLLYPENTLRYVFTFRERGREGEREGEKHRYVRETSIGYLSHAPCRGPVPQPRHVP